MPIVAQIWSQSATSCSARKRTTRGRAVVPEVSFRKCGVGPSHRIGVPSRCPMPFSPTRAAACTLASTASSSAPSICSPIGSGISPRRNSASKSPGHKTLLPSCTPTTAPRGRSVNSPWISRDSASISRKVRSTAPSLANTAAAPPCLATRWHHAVRMGFRGHRSIIG